MDQKEELVIAEYLKYQRELKGAKGVIQSLAARVEHFKIGKTGLSVEDRFAEPDYDGEYDNIGTVFSSGDPNVVSRMEAGLIDEFKAYVNCDNIRITDKDEMTVSDEYSVYVVWK